MSVAGYGIRLSLVRHSELYFQVSTSAGFGRRLPDRTYRCQSRYRIG